MIKIENWKVEGWEPAIRGMRNPKNSWERSDTLFFGDDGDFYNINGDTGPFDYPRLPDRDLLLGINDRDLMMRLANGGPVHAKYRRMIVVWADVTAPLFWWKEFDTYKVGTVRNSCSTMHKIHVAPFTIDNFSHEGCEKVAYAKEALTSMIETLEKLRVAFNTTGDKDFWRALIELLPDGYNMKATIMLNYEVLAGIYPMRRNHKLDEWHTFCDWIKDLPYSEIIIGKEKEEENV
jgi:hypothetical protein